MVRTAADDRKSSKTPFGNRQQEQLQRTLVERNGVGHRGQLKDFQNARGKLNSTGSQAPSSLHRRCLSPGISGEEISVSF